jgi:hypothetical protein
VSERGGEERERQSGRERERERERGGGELERENGNGERGMKGVGKRERYRGWEREVE